MHHPPWTTSLKGEPLFGNNDSADDAENARYDFALTLALATSREP
jgi:hypothetical protein